MWLAFLIDSTDLDGLQNAGQKVPCVWNKESRGTQQEEIYCQELAHSIMEDEKSQETRLISWRHRRARGLVLVQVHRPEIHEPKV